MAEPAIGRSRVQSSFATNPASPLGLADEAMLRCNVDKNLAPNQSRGPIWRNSVFPRCGTDWTTARDAIVPPDLAGKRLRLLREALPTTLRVARIGNTPHAPSYAPLVYRSAHYVDTILKGATLADRPVEQMTKFEWVSNWKMGAALDLMIPQPLLLRADAVIQ